MRGNALARPAVAGALDGFLLSSWHGHRDDIDLPPQVREVWAQKFAPRQPHGGQSNVDVAILDASGKVVRWFDSLEHKNGRMELRADRVEQYWLRMLAEARGALGMRAASAPTASVRLPEPKQGDAAVRVFAWLEDPGMPAYRAPTVEIASMTGDDWRAFRAPAQATKVDAAATMPWLQHAYPAGVMERTDQRTKHPFTIARVEGELTLEPAGLRDGETLALLTGKVTLFDTGGDGFCFSGDVTVVLTWRAGREAPASLRGVFEGTYPRTGPKGRREFPMRAVFESLAAATVK